MDLGHDDVIDVTGWTVIQVEPGGRDANKRWLAESPTAHRSEHWLWKSRQRTGGGDERALTDCAEVTVSRLAALLGLPAADCRYACDGGQIGLVSRNVAGDLDLNTGATYLPEVEGYERDIDLSERAGLMGAERGYTLSAVQDVLRGVGPPPTADQSLSAFEVFSGFLVLDALVGNGDRHPGNWALLETASGARLLAPTYDHGSALGAGLTERNRADRSPHAFARRGRAKSVQPVQDLSRRSGGGRSRTVRPCALAGCGGESPGLRRRVRAAGPRRPDVRGRSYLHESGHTGEPEEVDPCLRCSRLSTCS